MHHSPPTYQNATEQIEQEINSSAEGEPAS